MLESTLFTQNSKTVEWAWPADSWCTQCQCLQEHSWQVKKV